METPSFDRLQATRRNRKLRNNCAVIAGICAVIATVLWFDPIVSKGQLLAMPLLIVSFFCFLFAGLTVFFHMRYITRD